MVMRARTCTRNKIFVGSQSLSVSVHRTKLICCGIKSVVFACAGLITGFFYVWVKTWEG